MAINYDVWGTPDTWNDSSDYPSANIKYAKTDCDTFKKNYENGNIEYNSIDLSLAFWGIGKNAFFAQPKYLAPYTDNGVTGVKVYPVHDPVDVPCMFGATRTDNAIQAYNQRYKPNVAVISGNAGAYNTTMICDFNYQKIMVVPYILYKKPNDDYIASWDLKSYIDEDMALGYSQIVNIGYKMWTGDGVNNNRYNTYPCGFSPVFTHNAINYDVRYNNKIFYARGGYSQLTRGATRSNDRGTLLAPYYSAYDRITKNNTVDMTTALAYRYCVAEDANPNEIWYYFDDNPLWQVNGDSATSGYWCTFPYIHCDSDNVDEVKEYILQQLAYLGLPFCYDPALALRGQIGDTGIYLPVFDENGVTTGEYEEGEDALALPNAKWIDGRTGSGYDPYRPIPAGDLDNVTGRNLNFWSSNKYYLMRQYDLDKFLAIVNGLYTGGSTAEEKAEELRKMQVDFKGSNPSDYIVGLYGIPFQWAGGYQALQPVMLGPVEVLPNDAESDTAVELLNPDFNVELLFGEIQIPELGNFLDFEPYTTLMLYVPFCGTCKLDAAEYIGHSVRVVGTLDKHTGELAVRIIRDGQTVTNTMTGNLYVRVPITAQAMGTYETNLHQLQMAAFNREFGLLTGAVTGGVSMGAAAAAGGEGESGGGGMISPTAPISMAANLIQLPIAMADYEFRITHAQPPVFYSSSASSANQAKFYRKAKLFIKRPVFLDTYNTEIGKYVYGHTVGYACCKQVEHINDMASATNDHLIKCSNVCLTGIPATVEEINAIKQALCSGVYV